MVRKDKHKATSSNQLITTEDESLIETGKKHNLFRKRNVEIKKLIDSPADYSKTEAELIKIKNKPYGIELLDQFFNDHPIYQERLLAKKSFDLHGVVLGRPIIEEDYKNIENFLKNNEKIPGLFYSKLSRNINDLYLNGKIPLSKFEELREMNRIKSSLQHGVSNQILEKIQPVKELSQKFIQNGL